MSVGGRKQREGAIDHGNTVGLRCDQIRLTFPMLPRKVSRRGRYKRIALARVRVYVHARWAVV